MFNVKDKDTVREHIDPVWVLFAPDRLHDDPDQEHGL